MFLSASQDQNVLLWRLTLHTDEAGDGDSPTGHVTLVHQCKGHAGSVEAIDVSSDKSKVSEENKVTALFRHKISEGNLRAKMLRFYQLAIWAQMPLFIR